MDFTSNGRSGLGNYLIAAQAALVQVSMGFERRQGRLQIAAEASYRFSNASPGIRYVSSTGDIGDIAFSGHEVDASFAAGARVSRSAGGAALLARLGYRYSAFLVDQIDNVGKLPSEDLHGVTVGVELLLPRIGDRISLRTRGEVLLGGLRGQTEGLEDGTVSTANASWITAELSRSVSPTLSVEGIYRYHRAHTAWTGSSPRQGDVMEAGRVDTAHTVLLGLVGQL